MAMIYDSEYYVCSLIDMQNAFCDYEAIGGNVAVRELALMLQGKTQYIDPGVVQSICPPVFRQPLTNRTVMRTNCRNCAAALPFGQVCEYCGSIN